jgi:3-carboxy-cis,cis-muconate cycloisomerase
MSGMVQEHERALGGWQAEWVALPQLFLLASGATSQLVDMAKGLEVDTNRMRANLEITNGLIMAEAIQMALGEKLGRMHAHDLLEAASKRAASEGRPLREVIEETPNIVDALPAKSLDKLFDPLGYLGSADLFIERALRSIDQALAQSSKPNRKRR